MGLASPAAWLARAGHEVACRDLAITPLLSAKLLADADLVAFHLPMHTATRLAGPLIAKARAARPDAKVVCYGLYAPLNETWLRELGADWVIGGEYEAELTRLAADLSQDIAPTPQRVPLERLTFAVPKRDQLPALDRYVHLHTADGPRVTGYTEASRGCLHKCRHCPIVPVYDGSMRIVQAEVVLADIRQQVAAGAQHITFGDPDFFNGPTHARRIVEAFHAEFPAVTYDVTIKIEHLLRQRALLPMLRDTGCALITSAVESVDDRVLALLDKGHTRADFAEAAGLVREAGLNLSPTFVAFHPWTTLESYRDLLAVISELGLVENVSPIQLAIRLLIPAGSLMLELDDVRAVIGPFDSAGLCYRWTHPDPAVAALQRRLISLVDTMQRGGAGRPAIFQAIAAEAGFYVTPADLIARAAIPYLDEPWYC